MRKVEITRKYTPDRTFGFLTLDNVAICVTLELPWMGNLRGQSCIPEGNYKSIICNSPKFGKTFKVVNVPERDDILFHKGNIVRDSRGCILIGQYFGELRGEPGILNSRPALEFFLRVMIGEGAFDLTIRSGERNPKMNVSNFRYF